MKKILLLIIFAVITICGQTQNTPPVTCKVTVIDKAHSVPKLLTLIRYNESGSMVDDLFLTIKDFFPGQDILSSPYGDVTVRYNYDTEIVYEFYIPKGKYCVGIDYRSPHPLIWYFPGWGYCNDFPNGGILTYNYNVHGDIYIIIE